MINFWNVNTVIANLRIPSPYLMYQTFKYCIYSLLLVNFVLFFNENSTAAEHTFTSGVPLFSLIEAYSDTIDTAAWLLLLILFELETYVINDRWLTTRVKLWLLLIRSVSYVFIIYSLYGYLSRYINILAADPIVIADTCALIGTDYTTIVTLNDYVPITQELCQELNQYNLIQMRDTLIIGSTTDYNIVKNLAMVDVINASTWLLIVVILEVDVFLKTHHAALSLLKKLTHCIKIALYCTLLVCAIYWGIDGDFLDFWDAFLWLIAFVFIEMNLFEWQQELEQAKTRQEP
nr:hypothetical protein [Simiduia aestuariiviva]